MSKILFFQYCTKENFKLDFLETTFFDTFDKFIWKLMNRLS